MADDPSVRTLIVLVALVGCTRVVDDVDRLVNEGALQAATVTFAWPPRPVPPPPPPPSIEIRPAPVEIVAFLRMHAHDIEPWQVTLYELTDGEPRPPLFMGAHVRKRRILGRAAAIRLLSTLLQPIYSDGDCGCWVDTSLGMRIARGAATLDLAYNAGHLFLTPAWHDGTFVVLADGDWLEDIRDQARL